jgi:methylphosphotriester-DNA--protein-cysteine methyltransferase
VQVVDEHRLATFFIEHSMLYPDTHTQEKFRKEQFDNLCAWIDAHIHEPIGWTELMSESGFDHQSIQSSFAKYKATTPMTWIRKRREDLKSLHHQNGPIVKVHSILAK